MIQHDSIPTELRGLPRWVLWKSEMTAAGTVTKIPFYAKDRDLYKASVTDEKTWATFPAAAAAFHAHRANGLGFVFDSRDGFIGIDLDKCRHAESGVIDAWASAIIAKLNSYTEVSQSGTGIHIIARGTLPEGGRRKGRVEMYDHGRYFAMTGQALNGGDSIANRQTEIEALHLEIFGEKEKRDLRTQAAAGTPSLADEEIVTRASTAANGAKFTALWGGDISGYPSGSEADMALCDILAFWSGRDPAAIERLFLSSGMGRRDKARRPDYLKRTITNAISNCHDTWAPGSPSTPDVKIIGGVEVAQAKPVRLTLKTISSPELADLVLPPLEYLVEGLLPKGQLCALVSKKHYGKSWLTLHLACCVATGEPFLGRETTQGGVLFLGLEDGQRRIKSRQESLLDGRTYPPALHFATMGALPNLAEGGLTMIGNFIEDHPGTVLVIADTLTRCKGAGKRHADLWAEEAKLMIGLQELGNQHGVSIMPTHHESKRASDDPFDRTAGSGGLTSILDCTWFLDRPSRHSPECTLEILGRDIVEEVLAIRHEENGGWSYQGKAEEVRVSDLQAAILTAIAGNEVSPAELADILQRPIGSIKSALWRLGREGVVERAGAGRYRRYSHGVIP